MTSRSCDFGSVAEMLEPESMVLAVGTPEAFHPGDTCEVEITGIGVLSNPVVAEA